MFQKTGFHRRCSFSRSFKQKKYIWNYVVLWSNFLGATFIEPTFWEKRETSFFEISDFRNIVYFMNISAQTNDKILIFFSEDPPWKALQKLYEQIPIDSSIHLSNISFFFQKKKSCFFSSRWQKRIKNFVKKGVSHKKL